MEVQKVKIVEWDVPFRTILFFMIKCSIAIVPITFMFILVSFTIIGVFNFDKVLDLIWSMMPAK